MNPLFKEKIPVQSPTDLKTLKSLSSNSLLFLLILTWAVLFILIPEKNVGYFFFIGLSFLFWLIFRIIHAVEAKKQKIILEELELILNEDQIIFPHYLNIKKMNKSAPRLEGDYYPISIRDIADFEFIMASKYAPKHFRVVLLKNRKNIVYHFKNTLNKSSEILFKEALKKIGSKTKGHSPFSEKAFQIRKTKKILNFSMMLIAFICFMASIVFINLTRPIYFYSSIAQLAGISLCLGWALFYFLEKGPLNQLLSSAYGKKLASWIYTICLATFFFITLFLLNRFLPSPTSYKVVTVQQKFSQVYKGQRSYYVRFKAPLVKHKLYKIYDQTSNLKVWRKSYQKSLPGQTKVKLFLSHGFFGIPLIKGHKIILND